MKHSCGALLFTFDERGNILIVLGSEGEPLRWFNFKGCCDEHETYEQAAMREIYEETRGLVQLNSISLDHVFQTKNKYYHIGLVYVPMDIIHKFYQIDENLLPPEQKEKKQIRVFSILECLLSERIHSITKESILYYWSYFEYLQNQRIASDTSKCIVQSYPHLRNKTNTIASTAATTHSNTTNTMKATRKDDPDSRKEDPDSRREDHFDTTQDTWHHRKIHYTHRSRM